MFEIITFRLADGADAAELLAIEQRLQTEVVYHQWGFVRRSMGRHDDGRWLIVQTWATPAAATAGNEAIDASDVARHWSTLVTEVSIDRFDGVG